MIYHTAITFSWRSKMISGKEHTERLSWDDYFLEVANTISRRATCDRGRSGCVIAKNNQLLVAGYVGSPAGLPHCDTVGHEMSKVLHDDGTISEHCIRTVHAEQNAICQAAKRGISIKGGTIYTRMTPCRVCAMLIINCGIVRVVCERRYHTGANTEKLFEQAGVDLVYKYDEEQRYPDCGTPTPAEEETF
jgi:dCMP deaminase